MNKATFALGCFWHPDDFFSKLPGVKKVTVGYAGGAKDKPTYEDLGDHTETVEIEFDPKELPYEALLKHFWMQHDPTVEMKRQYRSVIFYHDDAQKQAAEKSRAERQKQLPRPILTAIEPAKQFWPAEDYHQKYLEKYRKFSGAS